VLKDDTKKLSLDTSTNEVYYQLESSLSTGFSADNYTLTCNYTAPVVSSASDATPKEVSVVKTFGYKLDACAVMTYATAYGKHYG